MATSSIPSHVNLTIVAQDFTQWPTYPQLLVNGELLGGCDIIMEMQQDGSLKIAVQEALGTQVNSKDALDQRLKQLLDSSPVMLFMKVPCLVLHCPKAVHVHHMAAQVACMATSCSLQYGA